MSLDNLCLSAIEWIIGSCGHVICVCLSVPWVCNSVWFLRDSGRMPILPGFSFVGSWQQVVLFQRMSCTARGAERSRDVTVPLGGSSCRAYGYLGFWEVVLLCSMESPEVQQPWSLQCDTRRWCFTPSWWRLVNSANWAQQRWDAVPGWDPGIIKTCSEIESLSAISLIQQQIKRRGMRVEWIGITVLFLHIFARLISFSFVKFESNRIGHTTLKHCEMQDNQLILIETWDATWQESKSKHKDCQHSLPTRKSSGTMYWWLGSPLARLWALSSVQLYTILNMTL